MLPLEIKGARTRLGYKQSDVAEKLGIPTATYRKKESGESRFTDKEKIALADFLELTPIQLNNYLYDGLLPIGK